ncbi:transcriptional regulator [Polynucleobacter sp. 30F-ANTBAC]|uniref:helix-turn-helix domain-containing protein n=1 Tax=Polynucleobacter sp. 30F-ANTBAC TaxID=2689095 RepID=UPI001C0E5237|nr:transcriptional regulator [Polynucleobacter sp. 30F-ANTBAC]MBU3600719.1 transcriptional regulator [Polynucleobacter sp. 30F-ANTBAC]
MKKRELFAELSEGMTALKKERDGKLTLKKYKVTSKPAPEVTVDELTSLREKLGLSRPVFADFIRTNPRTVENWEQGRAKPNAQAALIIKLISKYPQTFKMLASI